MANFDLSNRRRSLAASIEKFEAYSDDAMTGKSSLGRVASEKFDRPASTVRRPAAASAVRVTSAPSGSLRTISCSVVADTVVAPARSTCAGALSTTSMSRSVARNITSDPSASISTLARIGMVLRRSTTDCAWLTALSNAARSILIFICPSPIGPPGRANYPIPAYSQPFYLLSAGLTEGSSAADRLRPLQTQTAPEKGAVWYR